MAKLYDSNGWINWEYIDHNFPASFIMAVGARGIGKTYGLIRYLLSEGKPFIYLRRLKTQLDICATASGNPFRKVAADLFMDIVPSRSGAVVEYRDGEKLLAVGCALSTVATVRGFDFSEYDYIVFDECIPMAGERPIKDEFSAFLNFYETVNRNRELEGRAAVKCYMLGNANQLVNPYFNGWKFTKTALKMLRSGQMVNQTPDKTRVIMLLADSPISRKKRETALYQNANDDFLSMALDNAFRTDETNISSKPLAEYKHVVSVGDIGIYRHKSDGNYYVSSVTAEPKYDGYGMGLRLFIADYNYLRSVYMIKHNFIFESYENEILFRNYFKLE